MHPRNDPGAQAGGVPHSPERNTGATKRTVAITLIVVAFILVAVWVPW